MYQFSAGRLYRFLSEHSYGIFGLLGSLRGGKKKKKKVLTLAVFEVLIQVVVLPQHIIKDKNPFFIDKGFCFPAITGLISLI